MINGGEMTNDKTIVGEVIKDVCYQNANKYFFG